MSDRRAPTPGKDAGETIGDVKLSVDEAQLEQLVLEFNNAVTEIVGKEKSDRIKLEYEKLYRALKKSRESEKRLMNKCRDLHAEVLRHTSKVASMADDANQLASLQKENKRAWDIIDDLKRKDIESSEKLQDARAEVSKLTKLMEQAGNVDAGDSGKASFKDLVKLKTELELKLQEQTTLATTATAKLHQAVESATRFEEERQEIQSKLMEMSYEVSGKDAELQREFRRRERLEADLRKARTEAEEKSEDVNRLTSQLEKLVHDTQVNEVSLKEQKIISDRTQKEVELLQEQLSRSHDEYDKAASRAAALGNELQDVRVQLKGQEDETAALRIEMMKVNRQRDTLQRKVHLLEEAKREVEEQRDMYHNQAQGLDKNVDILKKAGEADKKVLTNLQRERDMLDTNVKKAAVEIAKQAGMAKQGEQTVRNLDTEIANYRAEAQKQRQIIYQLEKDRDRYINEAADLTQKVLKHIEEVKIRESEIFDLKKKTAEVDTRLKQQQNLYEAVRSDRNLYSKNLMESQDEITEMRRKLQVTHHTVDQLRDEISLQEQQMVKERLEKQNVIAERDMMNAEMMKMRQQMSEIKEYLLRQQQESARLLKIIRESDANATLQKKQLASITAERDILGSQLIRRNDELALLYEKIKIQQAVLDKGERGYHQRIEDIRILKLQIRQMQRELGRAKGVAAECYELRNEFFHSQRELLREKAKCKALEEELARPINIHRWRKLEGTDPSNFELIKKTQYIQRRLIRKVAMLARAHNLIQEKDRLYLELKRILARQPGLEVVEKISAYQTTLKTRTRQMQAMVGELNMYETKANESRFEVDRVTDELASVKKRYFIEKKKSMAALDAFHILKSNEKRMSALGRNGRLNQQRHLPAITPQRPLGQGDRFTGGGFNLRTSTSRAAIANTGATLIATKTNTTPTGSDINYSLATGEQGMKL